MTRVPLINIMTILIIIAIVIRTRVMLAEESPDYWEWNYGLRDKSTLCWWLMLILANTKQVFVVTSHHVNFDQAIWGKLIC